ncbi:MAG: D-Ala-D-Ala carboxypeptidase family metallohydrolase [Atribacterota bacterium]
MRKINDIKITEYFSLYEFECPCCRRVMLSPDLLARLDHLRTVINRPIYINSGYRCKDENQRVGGVPSSYHLVGMAADIYAQNFLLSDLLIYVKELGFNGIGFYEKENFLHVDIRPGERRIWKGKELIGY